MGIASYNKASELYNKASDIADVTQSNKVREDAITAFMSAIPYFEKAISLKPGEVDPLIALQNIYYILKFFKPEYVAKYNEMVNKGKDM